MDIKEIAKQVLYNYPNGIKVWQLKEVSEYFNVNTTELLKELCRIAPIDNDY